MAAFSTILLGAAVATSAVSAIGQNRAQKKAAAARREANAISSAAEAIRSRMERSRSAKEERIRRARMLSVASSTGSSDSSGLAGGVSALGTNFAGARANQQVQSNAALGISAANQRAADALSRAQMFADFGSFGQATYKLLS